MHELSVQGGTRLPGASTHIRIPNRRAGTLSPRRRIVEHEQHLQVVRCRPPNGLVPTGPAIVGIGRIGEVERSLSRHPNPGHVDPYVGAADGPYSCVTGLGVYDVGTKTVQRGVL